MNVQIIGISVDSKPCLVAWAKSLGEISFPLASDFYPHGAVAEKYGVLQKDGRSERAIFIIDEKGIIRYIDIHDIDEQPSNEVLYAEIAKINPGAVRAPAKEQEEAPRTFNDVVMYCNSWCPDCRWARAWLAEHRISYIEVDVQANPKAAAQVRKWANGSLVTPTFDIDGEIVLDFDKEKLSQILKIA